MTPSEIAAKAAELIGGNRAETHGPYKLNHQNIAALWTTWLNLRFPGAPQRLTLAAHDVAMMMLLLKQARTLTGHHNPDDYIDQCGYAAIAGGMREEDAALADKIKAAESA